MFSVFTEFRFRHENGAKIGREVRSDHFWSEKLTVEFFAPDASIRFDPKLMFSEFSEFRFRHGSGAKNDRYGRSGQFWREKLSVEFFATDAPNPSHLIKNSCLSRFLSFGSGTKTVRKSVGIA